MGAMAWGNGGMTSCGAFPASGGLLKGSCGPRGLRAKLAGCRACERNPFPPGPDSFTSLTNVQVA